MSIKKIVQKFIKNDEVENLPISEQLEKIGFFSLVDDKEKVKYIKKSIDDHYKRDRWLDFPNDWYISEVFKLPKYNDGLSTSDFRTIGVSPEDLFRGNFESYIKGVKPMFEKRGLQFDYKDENMDWKKDSEDKQYIKHTIIINNDIYLIYEGLVIKSGEVLLQYLFSYVNILNKVLQKQNSKEEFFILTAQDVYVYCILTDNKMKEYFEKIVNQTENKIIAIQKY